MAKSKNGGLFGCSISFAALVVCALCVPAVTFGETAKSGLVMGGSIASAISRDGDYDTKLGARSRYRATVLSPIQTEGGVDLVLEKFSGGSYGMSEKIAYSKKFDVTSLPGVKATADKEIKTSAESMYGCCHPRDMKWTKDTLEFSVRIKEKTFQCQTTSLDTASGPQISCK